MTAVFELSWRVGNGNAGALPPVTRSQEQAIREAEQWAEANGHPIIGKARHSDTTDPTQSDETAPPR